MTNPVLAFGVRGCGRHYPWPPRDVSDLPRNQWGSVNPDRIPADLTPLPSVTNVLSIVDRPALKGWAAEQAIRAMIADGYNGTDVDEAVDLYKYAFNKVSKDAADQGTRAHTLAERLTQDLPLPSSISAEDEAFADAYLAFWADHDPTPVSTETTVLDPDVGYAGTADLFAVIEGKSVVLDWKTRGKKLDEKKRKKYGLLYDETRMQLAALASASYVAEHCGPLGWLTSDSFDVVEGWGVVLFPDGTYDHEVLDADELDEWFDCFQGVLRAWRKLKGLPVRSAA